MKFLFFIFGLLAMMSINAQADTLYRWVDKDGKVHYGDRPADDAVITEPKKFAAPPTSGDDDLSYGIRKARQDFPLTLYVGKKCGDYCVQARSLLNKRGIPFVEKNLSTQEDIDAFNKLSGGNTIPTLMVGKSPLRGLEEGQWNSELDIAGYPKIAPYGTKPVQPATVVPASAPAADK